MTLVEESARVVLKDWVDHRPGSLHCVFAREESSIADHGVAQESLVRRFLSLLFFEKVQLSLVADVFLAGDFDASG
jgi:hypothetical protein